jgi:DNA/RNA endonuclease G (NUC1)
MSFALIGCNGCSRYKVDERAKNNSRDYSKPKVVLEKPDKPALDSDATINTTSSNISSPTLMELFKKYKSAVFMIITSDGKESKQGSGFFISSDGIGVSNYHVFEGTNKGLEIIKLESGEQFKISEVLASNKEDDYIIFRVNSNHEMNFFSLASTLPEIGEEVFAIGNPKGLEHTLSKGIISGYRDENKALIQTTAEITHGSSGGPLLNMKGELIGITTAGMGEANLNFAININTISIPANIKKKEKLLKTNNFLVATSTTGQIINHNYFTVSYSEAHEQAEWVAYKVTKDNFKNNIDRTNDYRFDPAVTSGSAELDDFKGSGYDMGHLAPARIMSHNYNSMSESFYLSNISPQVASFNRGIWKTLEGKVRYWASDKDSIYVFTGPILDNPIDHIGKNNVSVPRAFYKTLLGFYNGRAQGLAFIIPNEESRKSIFSYVTSIDEVEQITGIDFYFNINEKFQETFESNSNVKKWISKN